MSITTSELTYAGIPQADIVTSLKNLSAFIIKLEVKGIECLTHAAGLMASPGHYIDTIANAKTMTELADAVRSYPDGADIRYAARAFENVLETYASIKHVDQDPLCAEAYNILSSLRSWGCMPGSAFSVHTAEDCAAEKVMKSKKSKIAAANGIFTAMPAYKQQLGYSLAR